MPKHIKAPFNFVPVSDFVFTPPWSKFISHDIPLKEELSGFLNVKITAQTPIFIRDSENKEQFCNCKNQYFIPGSSIKGTIRNVFEIFTFSKMNKVSERRYAIRDLNSPAYTLKEDLDSIMCGWLSLMVNERNEEHVRILNCGEPYRISYNDLNLNKIKFIRNKSNQYQHNNSLSETITRKTFARDYPKNIANIDKRKFCKIANRGFDGRIVFTGKAVGQKKYEFVFFETDYTNRDNFVDVPNNVWNDFKLNYYDSKNAEHPISPDWAWRKEQLNKGEQIPVFFRLEDDGITVKDLGLSYLYKMPYNNSVYDCLPERHRLNLEPDMAECLFGFIGESCLKGRVHFSNAKLIANTANSSPKPFNTILGTPRASYYPIYLKQTQGNELGKVIRSNGNNPKPIYRTFQNDNARLSGWKRYLQNSNYEDDQVITCFKEFIDNNDVDKEMFLDLWNEFISSENYNEDNVNEDWEVKIRELNISDEEKKCIINAVKADIRTGNFYPLIGKDSNTKPEFLTKIRFHNLLPQELGALLSAITFHDNADCYHVLGMGKPYGLGQVKFDIEEISLSNRTNNFDKKACINKFEALMDTVLESNWHSSDQIKELLTLASIRSIPNADLQYMYLKDFAIAKKVTLGNQRNEAVDNGFYLRKISDKYGAYINDEYVPITQEALNEANVFFTFWQNKKLGNIVSELKNISKVNSNNQDFNLIKIDDILTAVILKNNKVIITINKMTLEVQLTLNKSQKEILPAIGQLIKVRVKQLKKDGTINQVGWVD